MVSRKFYGFPTLHFSLEVTKWVVVLLVATVTARTSLTLSLVSAVECLVCDVGKRSRIDAKIRIFDIGDKSASVDTYPFVCHMLSDEREQVRFVRFPEYLAVL